MERLTYRTELGVSIDKNEDCPTCSICWDCDIPPRKCVYISDALKKLADYEDLEEQGRLVKLPCKVGDTVWQIMVVGVQGKNIKYGIFKAIVLKISVDYQMNFLLSTITEVEKRYRNEVTSTAIGDTMFFTKSEAEAKLKELRGGE